MPTSSPIKLAGAVIRYSREAIVSHTVDGLITSWNPAAQRMFGYAREEVLGMALHLLVPPECLEEQHRFDEAIANGSPVDATETRRLRKDGSRINVAISIAPLFDRAGNPLGAATVMRDIQTRKQLEARLQFLESVVSSCNDSITTRDNEGMITSWNKASEILYGYTAEEAVGQRLAMLVPPEVPNVLEEIYDRPRAGERIEHFETIRMRKDGVRIHVSLSASPILDEFGQLVGACAIARDISESRRRAEQIERWALQDPLTGLPNRRTLLDRLTMVLGRTRRSGMFAALLFVDLDDFKRINDVCGHVAGDEVLIEVARRINAALRATDTVARMGGDEFVVLLDELGTDHDFAVAHAEGVGNKLLEELRGIEVGSIKATASLGLTVFSDGIQSVDELLQRADRAMYAAKKAGKDRLQMLDDC
jgi:diguanylate cyclase (GGDEF)-like protein/PAS domain S-box-containing protein